MFLYIRMFLITGVTLYTSREVLNLLGVSDYGIYNLVAGIVAMVGFFNSAMATATQRYLSFDIGNNDIHKLSKTFSISLTIHFGIAILVLLLAETIGLWYVNCKMVLPEDRLYAANIIYQFSVFSFFVKIIQVPYNALIIARERMKVFAFVSILEAILKLGAVFLLFSFGTDKLILYGFLSFIVVLLIRVIYQIYCRKKFVESKFKLQYDKTYFKELLIYSGWNLFGNLAAVARGQGNNLVLNLFFGTIINAAYGVTMQVQSALRVFVNNFQLAANPQIIKSYAQNDLQRTYRLIFQSSKFSFFLTLLIILPIWYNIEFILNIWLIQVPKYTNDFIRLLLMVMLIDSMSGSLMTGVQATGKIKWYQIIVGTLVFLNLPISYFLLKVFFFPPTIVFKVMIVVSVITLFFRLYFLKKTLYFPVFHYFKKVLTPIILVFSLTITVLFYVFSLIHVENLWINFILRTLLIVAINISVVTLLGLTKSEKKFIKNIFLRKI